MWVGINRTARLTGKVNALRPLAGMLLWYGGNQGARIWMQRPPEDLCGGAKLDDLSQVHHHNAIAQQSHHVEIVRDKQITHAELASQFV